MPWYVLWGVGKLTSPLSANANVLSATFRFPPPFRPYYDVSVVPAGGERGVTGRALALAESGDINLPTPCFVLMPPHYLTTSYDNTYKDFTYSNFTYNIKMH